MYAPLAVEILTASPSLMNSGTCTILPVSSVAGFCTLLALSPRTALGGLHDLQNHRRGQFDLHRLALGVEHRHREVFGQVLLAAADEGLAQGGCRRKCWDQ